MLWSKSCKSFLLAVSYTLGPIGVAAVLVWVGMWKFLDHVLFPQDKVASATACLVLATGLLAPLCHALSSSSNNNNNTSSATFVVLTASLGVCLWRGVWYLWESLVFANDPLVQSLLAIMIGVGILMMTGNFKHTVVGPPILFPPSSFEESSLVIPNDVAYEDDKELRTPLQQEDGSMESAIAMTAIKDCSA